MKKIILFILIFVLINTISARAEKMLVAVLDLEPKAGSKSLAGAVTDIIRSEMVKTGLFTILERTRMNEILNEHELQSSGCTDQTCAVQLGKLLSARKVLLGEINMIGNTFIITVRIVDVEKGTSDFSANEKAESEDKLDVAARNISANLSQNIVDGNRILIAEKKSIGGYYMRSIVPGWGQWYADKPVKGIGYFTLFAASGVLFYYGHTKYLKAKDDYDNLNASNSSAEYKDKRDAYKTAATRAKIYLGIFVASYVVNWVDIMFFSKPDFNPKAAANTGVFTDFKIVNTGNTIYKKPETRMDLIFGVRF